MGRSQPFLISDNPSRFYQKPWSSSAKSTPRVETKTTNDNENPAALAQEAFTKEKEVFPKKKNIGFYQRINIYKPRKRDPFRETDSQFYERSLMSGESERHNSKDKKGLTMSLESFLSNKGFEQMKKPPVKTENRESVKYSPRSRIFRMEVKGLRKKIVMMNPQFFSDEQEKLSNENEIKPVHSGESKIIFYNKWSKVNPKTASPGFRNKLVTLEELNTKKALMSKKIFSDI
jgi:hypothetical protein